MKKRGKHEKETKRPKVLKKQVKKVIDTFVDIPKVSAKEVEVAQADVAKCECGCDAHPGNHQCWACSHRA